MTRLKKLVLNNPVVLKLSEPQLPDSSQLTQYVIKLEEEEYDRIHEMKFLDPYNKEWVKPETSTEWLFEHVIGNITKEALDK